MNKNMYDGLEYSKLFYKKLDGDNYGLYVKLYLTKKREISINMSDNLIIVDKTKLDFIKENIDNMFIIIDDDSINGDEFYETHISLYYVKNGNINYIANVNIPYWENLHNMNPSIKSIEPYIE